MKTTHIFRTALIPGIRAKDTAAGKLHSACITLILLLFATALSFLYFRISHNSANVALIYILTLILIARMTDGYFSLLTSATTTHMKQQMQIISERERLLVEAEKEKMRANLLRAISHDLRTPLTSIIGAGTSYLENSSYLNEQQKQGLVAQILEDSNWLLNMVENLLSVTRIQGGSANVNKSWESVEEVLSEAVIRLKKRLPDARITVQVPDELLMIPMDAILIEQVLINLLENAVLHSKSQQPVSCYVQDSADSVYFHVRDYGIGIAPDKQKNLFDGTAYTGNLSSDSSKGMGIGLSICKTIITAHKGHIDAVNCGQGTDFYFSLPKA